MKRYFVDNVHRASDAGAMERDLMEYAGRIYNHVLVNEDSIHVIAEHVEREQRRILSEKPRRQAVKVDWGISEYVPGHAYVLIGTSQINLTLVLGSIDEDE